MPHDDTYQLEYRISSTAIHDRPVEGATPVADLNTLELHIKANDYFAMMSTVLGFLKESIGLCNANGPLEHVQLEAIDAARKDLAYLHENYRIVPK